LWEKLKSLLIHFIYFRQTVSSSPSIAGTGSRIPGQKNPGSSLPGRTRPQLGALAKPLPGSIRGFVHP
jgi:hypothetical protein